MDDRKLIGKFHEKRGEDYFTVYATKSGEVVQIEQYDARAAYSHWLSINFWADEAPRLIELIQKATGTKPAYEYAIEETDYQTGEKNLQDSQGRVWTDIKEHAKAKLDLRRKSVLNDNLGRPYYTYKLVRRPKVEGYEVLLDE